MKDITDIPLQAENPYHFSAKRFTEMSNILRALRAPKQTKLVFQTLPKHMRRRAATQNPKRLPRRLRATHTAQFKKSGVPVKSKRPTRKYRRKPTNLRGEYAKRGTSPKPGWLETHLWHAKRFHMVSRWGYRLPWSPCDKSYRACYRANSKYCLMQDVSYLVTLQLTGPFEVLKAGLQKITSSMCGLTMTAKGYLDGRREGQVYLFKADQYPMGCLGSVTFFWLPPRDGKSSIWLSCHPAFVESVKEELRMVFELDTKDSQQRYQSALVDLQDMEREFNRFRLSGPLAQLVVSRALKGVTITDRQDLPLHAYLSNQMDIQRRQQEFLSTLQRCENVHQLPSSLICSVVVEDPRLNRPDGRQPIRDRVVASGSGYVTEIPDNLNESALFHPDVIQSVTQNVMSPGQYSKARNAASVVPGQRCRFENQMQACPIILIQRPGEQGRLGFNSGWDVLVPKGYGATFWLSFIMWGARAGGLREDFNTQREAKRHSFMPDTEAGRMEALVAQASSRDAYFRKPCNKRHNYIKLAVASPFLSPWRQLLREWQGNSEHLHVIRDRSILKALQEYMDGRTKSMPEDIRQSLGDALVPVTFSMSGRGSPGPNALICIPEASDKMPHKKSSSEIVYTEPLRRDPFEVLRKKCRQTHLQLLAKMRRKRLKAKRALQKTSTRKVTIAKPLTEKIIADQHRKMCDMWLPSSFESIRRQCSKETVGYCTTADFSFVEGSACGTGYVTFNGLLQNPQSPNRVLIRDTRSRQYRCATITVAHNS